MRGGGRVIQLRCGDTDEVRTRVQGIGRLLPRWGEKSGEGRLDADSGGERLVMRGSCRGS